MCGCVDVVLLVDLRIEEEIGARRWKEDIVSLLFLVQRREIYYYYWGFEICAKGGGRRYLFWIVRMISMVRVVFYLLSLYGVKWSGVKST